MMSDMALTVVLEGKPEDEVWKHKEAVEPWQRGWMTMDHLMLKRAVPGNEISAQRKEQPDRQAIVEPGHEPESAIDHQGHQNRRPAHCRKTSGVGRRGSS